MALKVFSVLIVLLVLLATIQIIAAYRFKALAADLMLKVASAPPPVSADQYPPTAILRFAERSGVTPNHLARTINLSQTAQMRLAKDGDWAGLVAEQVISTGASGFVWLAVQPMGPLIKFRVIDAYVAGQGRLDARAFGSIPVASSTGPETDRAEAMRYLAELVWAPDAMLGNPDLQWQENLDGSVSARLDLPTGPVSVQFFFGENGDILRVEAKDRPAETIDGQVQTHDWRITINEYRNYGPRRTASKAEVGYVYEDGYQAYWRGVIIAYSASP